MTARAVLLAVLAVMTFTIPAAADTVPGAVLKSAASVVRVEADSADYISNGSGFVIQSDKNQTLVATNYHVVEDDPYSISVWVGGDETVSASILAYSKQKDLCVLKLGYPAALKALPLSPGGAGQGDAIYAVGFPAAADEMTGSSARTSGEATITDGIISAVRKTMVVEFGSEVTLLQINAALNPGNSGGPLFDKNGAVVGINTYGAYDSQGIFGAIAVSELTAFLADNGISLPSAAPEQSALPAMLVLTGVAAALAAAFFLFRRRTKKKAGTLGTSFRLPARSRKPESLAARVASGPLKVHQAVSLLMPAAVQLRDLHSQGRAFLNLSPDKIVCRGDGASLPAAGKASADRMISGYTPPEVYRGKNAGGTSDVYSFCAVLLFAVTGKTPLNALDRADLPGAPLLPEGDGSAAPDLPEEFLEILRAGMAVVSAGRIPSMQELITRLTPYNIAEAESAEAPPRAAPASPETAPEAGAEWVQAAPAPAGADMAPSPFKARERKLVVIATAALVVFIGGTVFGLWNYHQAVSYMLEDNFSAADTYYNRSFFMGGNRDMVRAYIDAGLLLEGRDYAGAQAAFETLAHEGGWDAERLFFESYYRQAAAYADADNFNDAVRVYTDLSAVQFKDSEELVDKTKFRQAAYLLYVKGDSARALRILTQLQDDGFRNGPLDDTVLDAREAVLQDGIFQYRSGDYQAAYKLYFSQIPDEEASYPYIMLCAAHGASYTLQQQYSVDTVVEALKSHFNLEDADEVLVSTHEIACTFLTGTWRTKGGGDYFKMTKESESYRAIATMPTHYGKYAIRDGIITIKTSSGDYRDEFKVTVAGPDTIMMYCYEDGLTYTLYRA